MEIKITPKPRKFSGHSVWDTKVDGVVLVEKEEDIEPLYKLLVEQDDYWEGRKNLIKVAPKEIEHEQELDHLCEYVGKTDIYNLEELQEKIPFIIYQRVERSWY